MEAVRVQVGGGARAQGGRRGVLGGREGTGGGVRGGTMGGAGRGGARAQVGGGARGQAGPCEGAGGRPQVPRPTKGTKGSHPRAGAGKPGVRRGGELPGAAVKAGAHPALATAVARPGGRRAMGPGVRTGPCWGWGHGISRSGAGSGAAPCPRRGAPALVSPTPDVSRSNQVTFSRTTSRTHSCTSFPEFSTTGRTTECTSY